MKTLTTADPETKSADIVKDNIERLKSLFPELVTEGPAGAAINVDVLKALVGDKTVTDSEEKYGLNWHGKRSAKQLALTPSTGTLRPCPEDSVDWDTTQNLMIEGDNLEVLKLLQKSYAGKVKLIYIDPPYNTGEDFVYPDNFQDSIKNYLELTGQVEGGRKISSNTEASGRFHTDWLNMMYPRLKLARNLLRDDGIILISIDATEVAKLRVVSDDIFGEENFLIDIIWKNGRTAAAHFAREHEYLLCYAKSKIVLPLFKFEGSASISERAIKRPSEKNPVSQIKFSAGIDFESEDKKFPKAFGDSEPIKVIEGELEAKNGILASDVVLEAAWTMKDMIESWLDGEDVVDQKGQKVVRFFFKNNGVLQYEKEKGTIHPKSIVSNATTKNGTNEVKNLLGEQCFDFPKPSRLIQEIVEALGTDNSIILDFFAGSGTTGHAVMAQNVADGGTRRYILVQLPEPLDPENKKQKAAADYCDKLKKPRNIAELTKERLRRAAKKIKTDNPDYKGDLGFRVYKLASSNIRAWEPDRDNLAKTLEESVEHLKTDRTEADILYELLLKLGLDLCVPIEARSIAGKEVHAIGGGVLMACLAETISRDEVEPLAQGIVEWHKALAPAGDTACVFRDSAFVDDVAKTNMAAIIQQHGIATVRSL